MKYLNNPAQPTHYPKGWHPMPNDFLSRTGYFEGNLEDALAHAVPLDGPADVDGFPLAVTSDPAKSAVGADLTLTRLRDGRLTNKGFAILGDQGIGKTFTLYVLLYMWFAEHFGAGISGGIEIDSLKHNNADEPETYSLITTLLECVVIQVSKIRLNPLSKLWDFTYYEQYRMIKTMLEVNRGGRLDDLERQLLERYLRISFYEEDNPSLERLSELVMSFEAGAMYTPVQAAEMELTSLRLSAAIANLTTGEFGKVFSANGNDEELLMLIEQRAKSWDFKDIEPQVRSVIEVFRGAVKMSALAPKDPSKKKSGPKHPERVAQCIVRDEAYDAWANPIFAEHEFTTMKTLRELDTTLGMGFHRLSDFLRAVGSAKAAEVIKEIPTWLVGRQHEADLPDIREFMNLPEHVIRTLPHLTKGFFWLIMPGRAPRLLLIVGTGLEITTFVTNQANEALLQRYLETDELQYYLDWLVETTPPMVEPDQPHEMKGASDGVLTP